MNNNTIKVRIWSDEVMSCASIEMLYDYLMGNMFIKTPVYTIDVKDKGGMNNLDFLLEVDPNGKTKQEIIQTRLL